MNPTDYAVVVGIDHYHSRSNLAGAVNDAQAVAQWLLAADGGGLPSENLQLLVSPSDGTVRPTVADAVDAFARLVEQSQARIQSEGGTTAGRRLYLYFAGHAIEAVGVVELSVLMADASAIYFSAIPLKHYADWFRAAGLFEQILVIADCCRDSRVLWAIHEPTPFVPLRTDPGAHSAGWMCYLRVGRPSGRWEVMAADGRARGVFTAALLDGLSGEAARPNGVVTLDSLTEYMTNRFLSSWVGKPPDTPPTLEWEGQWLPGESPVLTEGKPPPHVRIRVAVSSSDSTVSLINANLQTIETRGPGPQEMWFDLPPGLYLLQASHRGGGVANQVMVKATGREVIDVTL